MEQETLDGAEDLPVIEIATADSQQLTVQSREKGPLRTLPGECSGSVAATLATGPFDRVLGTGGSGRYCMETLSKVAVASDDALRLLTAKPT